MFQLRNTEGSLPTIPPSYFGYLPLQIRIVYAARELPIEGVTAGIIFNKMKKPHKTLVTKQNLMETLRNRIRTEGVPFDVVMTLGAGDINTLVKQIKELLSQFCLPCLFELQ